MNNRLSNTLSSKVILINEVAKRIGLVSYADRAILFANLRTNSKL